MKLTPAAILFDMDGVLIDSLDSWWNALNESLKAFDKEEITREQFIERYWGKDLEYNLRTMDLADEIINRCNNVYGHHVDIAKIYPDTKKILEKLSSYKKGVVTNTPRDCAIHVLEKFNIKNYFDTIMTNDDVKIGKPEPEIIFKACRKLNVEPKDVILIGDTQSDIVAGHAAGCKVIGMRIDADYRIERLSDLVTFFQCDL